MFDSVLLVDKAFKAAPDTAGCSFAALLRRLILSLCILGLLWPAAASAQMMNPGGQRPGGGLGNQPKKDKPAGPAEAAPEAEEEEEAELPALPPWPGQETKKLQLFTMNGYLRLRIDIFQNGNLGMGDIGSSYRTPFYRPISETNKSSLSCSDRAKTNKTLSGDDRGMDPDSCPAETLAGANMRLRLEPTINISEDVRIHAQFDIFDNLVLGSTPNGMSADERAPNVPLVAFSDTQAPPIAGRNSRAPAILVKRAWAEVGTPFGQLRFGRMPSQWGLGLLANNGSCWDCNYGDSADRIMFVTKLVGHIIGAGYDFASSGPSSLSVTAGGPYYSGQAIDLEPLDDVSQWVFIVGKIDPDEVIKDKVEQGELVINYGSYVVYRKQDFDYASGTGLDTSVATYATKMVERHAWAVIPDLWFKLMYKKFYFELEGVLIAGKIENTSDSNKEDPLDIMQWGWAMKTHYKFLKDSLMIGLEMGMASGDQSENFELNRKRILTMQDPNLKTKDGIALDTASTEFRFDYDYHVDLILFREILGTVANAFYWKPWIQYNLVDSFGARLDMIHSVAHKPIAYPGNDPNLGVELDLNIFYKNVEEGFYAGLQYGVLFPLAGLDRPAEIPGIGTTYEADAEVAHTVQARMMVKF